MDTCPLCERETRSQARAQAGARVVCLPCEKQLKESLSDHASRQMTLKELS